VQHFTSPSAEVKAAQQGIQKEKRPSIAKTAERSPESDFLCYHKMNACTTSSLKLQLSMHFLHAKCEMSAGTSE